MKLHRRTDPAMSQQYDVGRVMTQAERLAIWVERHPGCTPGELADLIRDEPDAMDRWQLSKRYTTAERAGWIRRGNGRKCSILGTAQTTWHPIKPKEVGRA